VPGSRLACAVRRRWPARAAEKGAGGVPRAVFCFLFPTRDAEKHADNERQSETTDRRPAEHS
jgi:hypothetical protein